MIEIEKLKNKMILLEGMVDEDSLLPEGFLINNMSFACKDASPEY